MAEPMMFRQIAAALGISHGTVQNDYWRAILKLSAALGVEPIEPPPSRFVGSYRQRHCTRCGALGHQAKACR